MPPQPHHHAPGSINDLIGLVACLLPGPFAGQGLFHSPLFSRFQVVRVFLNFLDNVFLLDLTLEATQRVFEGFSLLKSHFSQTSNTPIPCIAIWAHSKQQLFEFSPIPLGQVKSIFGGPATETSRSGRGARPCAPTGWRNALFPGLRQWYFSTNLRNVTYKQVRRWLKSLKQARARPVSRWTMPRGLFARERS
jgi:hypothetical protein